MRVYDIHLHFCLPRFAARRQILFRLNSRDAVIFISTCRQLVPFHFMYSAVSAAVGPSDAIVWDWEFKFSYLDRLQSTQFISGLHLDVVYMCDAVQTFRPLFHASAVSIIRRFLSSNEYIYQIKLCNVAHIRLLCPRVVVINLDILDRSWLNICTFYSHVKVHDLLQTSYSFCLPAKNGTASFWMFNVCLLKTCACLLYSVWRCVI